MDYQECIEWLEGVSLYSKKDGLANMFQLMEEFGNPQEKIPAIHVAGTNGKGTTCALLGSILTESGRRAGMYTSPHLVRYTERIRVDGAEIPAEDFARLGTSVRQAAQSMEARGLLHPTFFQLLTAIAFLYFAERQVDMMILEVGVGGRLDATNIIRSPLVSVIASVSLDHTKVLGTTIPEIAAEKAGIIKSGCPVVMGRNKPEAAQVIRERAQELHCRLIEADRQSCEVLRNDETGISLRCGGILAETSLCGDYQIENLKTALAVCRELNLPQGAVEAGVRKTRWKGRMQWITSDRHADLLLEGAHNEEGAQALDLWCREHLRERDVTLVFSALRKKDIRAILRSLTGSVFRRIVFARLQDSAGMDAELFLELAAQTGYPGTIDTCQSTKQALKQAFEKTAADGVIVCAGSLYLVGEVKRLLAGGDQHA